MALGSFTISLDAFKVKTEKQMITACQKIAMECWKRVIEKSPVDTGRFRANWGCAIGSPYSGVDESASDKSGGATTAKAITVTAGWNLKQAISLVNNVKYSLPLEFGHSQQAPSGMVRITVSEMQNGAAEAAIK